VRSPEGPFRLALLLSLLLAGFLAALYWPATGYDFVYYDDNAYVYENPAVLGGLSFPGVKEAFTSLRKGLWLPLTWISLMGDASLFGTSPFGFHLTNILLFAAASALLLLVLWRLTGDLPVAAAAAALFALHPMRVESVAWITERKDCLSFLFLVLALGAYVRYARTERTSFRAATAALFAMALMAKPGFVTFPLLLLLLDWWPLGRWSPPVPGEGWGGAARAAGKLAWEKAPLLLLSGAVTLVTVLSHHSAYSDPSLDYSWPVGLERFLASPFIYLRKTVWPFDLALVNQHPWPTLHREVLLLSLTAFLLLTFALARVSSRRPWLLFGWGWFVVGLVPGGGIVPTGAQWISDRLALLSHVGLFLALAREMKGRAAHLPRPGRRCCSLLLLFALCALALLTTRQVPVWKDSFSLTLPAMGVQEEDVSLRGPLDHLESLPPERRPEAIRSLQQVLLAHPGNLPAHFHLGNLYYLQGEMEAAEREMRSALGKPFPSPRTFALANARMGEILVELGRDGEAEPYFRRAVAILPQMGFTTFNLAALLSRQGRDREAVGAFLRALALEPGEVKGRIPFIETLARLGRLNEAEIQADVVARRIPGSAEAALAQGLVLEAKGRRKEARDGFHRGLSLPAAFPGTKGALVEKDTPP